MTGADALIKNITSANDALLLGGLLGHVNSNVDLKSSPVTQNYQGGNVGVYATYLRGGWFADLMSWSGQRPSEYAGSSDYCIRVNALRAWISAQPKE